MVSLVMFIGVRLVRLLLMKVAWLVVRFSVLSRLCR